MRIYTVHIPEVDAVVRAVAVKEGFSWPAFVFSVVWALWHRLWLAAALFLVANLALGLLIFYIGANQLVQAVVSIGLAVIIGSTANDFRRRKLGKKGFGDGAAVIAPTGEAAVRRYFEESRQPDPQGV